MRRRDFIATLTRDAMLERLEPMRVDARTVVDVSAGRKSARRLLKRRFRRAKVVALDAPDKGFAMPFDDGAVDVVFANLALLHVGEPGRLFGEVARVLRQDGLFMFSTFGPDTLPALEFPDMHDVGDAAVRAGLRDPVLDVDRSTLSYDDHDLLAKDLGDLGLEGAINNVDSPLSLELELVFGHCWGGRASAGDGSIHIDPAEITRR